MSAGFARERAVFFTALAVVGVFGVGWALQQEKTEAVLKKDGSRAIFWTWDRLEPDTLACAWLIEEFISPGCEIRLIPDRGRSMEGTPFDIPLAELVRTRMKSSFHVIREQYALKDPALLQIERWVDEIETDGWDRAPGSEAASLDQRLRSAAEASISSEQALASAHRILDEIYASLSKAKEGGR